MELDVKQAVRAAKEKVIELFAEEGIEDVGLEEVKFDDDSNEWLITIGFTRAIDKIKGPLGIVEHLPKKRTYRIVRLGATGALTSVEIRQLAM